MSRRDFLVGRGQVYSGVRVVVDGKTYELHYHGSKKSLRCYEIAHGSYRKVGDENLVAKVLARSVEIRKQTEERNARITAAGSPVNLPSSIRNALLAGAVETESSDPQPAAAEAE